VPVADGVDAYFSSDAFCANTCHIMTATLATEMRESRHRATPTGVRPGCSDCHLSRRLTAAMRDHVVGTRELFAFLFGGIRTVEAFETVRAAAADRVRFQMLGNDSRNCRNRHELAAIRPERKRGQRQYEEALKEGVTCIACHCNLVHKEVPPSKDFEAAISGK